MKIGTKLTISTRSPSGNKLAPNTRWHSLTSTTPSHTPCISPYHAPKNVYIRVDDPNLHSIMILSSILSLANHLR